MCSFVLWIITIFGDLKEELAGVYPTIGFVFCLLGFLWPFNAAGDAAAGALKDVDSADILHERRVGCPQRQNEVSLANIAWLFL